MRLYITNLDQSRERRSGRWYLLYVTLCNSALRQTDISSSQRPGPMASGLICIPARWLVGNDTKLAFCLANKRKPRIHFPRRVCHASITNPGSTWRIHHRYRNRCARGAVHKPPAALLGVGCEGDLAATSVTPLIARVDSADLAG